MSLNLVYSDNTNATVGETTTAAATTAAADGPSTLNASTHENENLPGMRREWNFTLTFQHEAARLQLLCPPHWEPGFIDPERIEQLNKLDRDVKHCPMTPVLKFVDFSSPSTLRGGLLVQDGAAAGGGAAAAAGGSGDSINVNNPNASTVGGGAGGMLPRDLGMQRGKQVEVLYSHIPPFITLSAYCVGSVQHILKDPHVTSVDNQKRLSRLRVGKKLSCPYRLGGYPSFHFYYTVQQKTELVTHDVVYCIGTIIGQRGYLVTVRCAEEGELNDYLKRMFLPYICNPANIKLDVSVTYGDIPSSNLLSERSQRFGELKYEDRDAAVSFSLPMHPLRLRPDFSPTKTVGVGSIACMTLELSVYESLIDDAAVAEITGMPKYKINLVVLCVEVEDLARMNYPGVITTEEYSQLKTKRLLDLLTDAKVVGTPTSLQMGPRIGRSHTITFEYEPFNGPAKAMYVSTMVGNFGVTAYYLTKLGGGYFETHLYLYKQLLSRLQYQQQHKSNITFSRFDVVNVRLLDSELYRCYTSAPVDKREVFLQHSKALVESNDGKTDDAEEVPVPEEEGGFASTQGGVRRGSFASQSQLMAADMMEAAPHTQTEAAAAAACFGPLDADYSPDEGDKDGDVDAVSLHSQSLISVSSIPHLQGPPDSEDSDEEAGDTRGSTSAGAGTTLASRESGAPTAAAASGSGGGANGLPLGSSGCEEEVMSNSNSGLMNTSAHQNTSRRNSRPLSGHHTMVPTGVSGYPDDSAHVHSPSSGMLLEGAPAFTIDDVEGSPRGISRDSDHLPPPSRLTREMLTGPAVLVTLESDPLGPHYHHEQEPGLRDLYVRCCEEFQCKPNSYLLQRLPADPRYADMAEELDLSANYVGHAGFMAILNFLSHLPNIRHVHFNNMSLDNTDIENMCEVLGHHPTISSIHLRQNPKVTLPCTKMLFRLLQSNRNVTTLGLHGTRIGDSVIAKLEARAAENKRFSGDDAGAAGAGGYNDAEFSGGNGSQTDSVDNANIP